MARLSVVVVTHDHREAVGQMLRALTAELGDEDELIVVDNASTDGTPDAVREAAPDATVAEEGKNLGFAAASNRGAAVSSGDLLLFLNPDAVVAPGFRDEPRTAAGRRGRVLSPRLADGSSTAAAARSTLLGSRGPAAPGSP
ncbi:MAG: glycosyltransferase [Actinobacteria bacterium]|nr:MAG: glycosyltransferase [Actinomycetota bacterium]